MEPDAPEAEVVERLVHVTADDGLELSGVSIAAVRPGPTVVWLHGFGVSFDLSQTVQLGRALARRGISFVTGNMRGHAIADVGWKQDRDRIRFVRVGSAWEKFEDSGMDVAAWVRYAATNSKPPLVLAGHSFGASRLAFYLSEPYAIEPDGVILASPSLGLRHLEAGFAEEAARLVEAGEGERLLPEGSWPRGFGIQTVSAQTYASWWKVAPELFDPARSRFRAIRVPTLMYYGAVREVGGIAELDYFARLLGADARAEQRILDGVDHSFREGANAIADAIDDWGSSVLPGWRNSPQAVDSTVPR